MTSTAAFAIDTGLGDTELSENHLLKNRLSKKTATRTGKKRSKSSARSRTRTSTILKRILEENSGKTVSVEEIVNSLGTKSFGASLMAFSIPEVLPIPVPGLSAAVAIPTGIISTQMIRGKGEIHLPDLLLKRSVPRSALAGAIHGVLPLLERAESKAKVRWRWTTTKTAQRFLGFFILLLAAIIALPIPFTNMPCAIAIFIIALGMAEQDGALIALGLLIGLVTLLLIGAGAIGLLSLFSAATAA
jgi:hypothetical protein